MKRSSLEIDALAVCLGAMGIASVNIANALYDVVGVVTPLTTLPPFAMSSESSDDYVQDWRRSHEGEPMPSEQELTRLRLADAAVAIARERNGRTQSLLADRKH